MTGRRYAPAGAPKALAGPSGTGLNGGAEQAAEAWAASQAKLKQAQVREEAARRLQAWARGAAARRALRQAAVAAAEGGGGATASGLSVPELRPCPPPQPPGPTDDELLDQAVAEANVQRAQMQRVQSTLQGVAKRLRSDTCKCGAARQVINLSETTSPSFYCFCDTCHKVPQGFSFICRNRKCGWAQ